MPVSPGVVVTEDPDFGGIFDTTDTLIAHATEPPTILSRIADALAQDDPGRHLHQALYMVLGLDDQGRIDLIATMTHRVNRPSGPTRDRIVEGMGAIYELEGVDRIPWLDDRLTVMVQTFSLFENPPPGTVSSLLGRSRLVIEEAFGHPLSPAFSPPLRDMIHGCIAAQQERRQGFRRMADSGVLRLVRERLRPVWQHEGLPPNRSVESRIAERLDIDRRALAPDIDSQIEAVVNATNTVLGWMFGQRLPLGSTEQDVRELVSAALFLNREDAETMTEVEEPVAQEPEGPRRTAYEMLDDE